MSKGYTSEEYEYRDVPIEMPEKIVESGDHDLVLKYTHGRNLSDIGLPYEIGVRFIEGTDGFFKSEEFGIKWLKRACDAGNIDAMNYLALFYLEDTKKYGYADAARLLRKSADLGHTGSLERLELNKIKDYSTKDSFIRLRLNAELDDPDACFVLAECFRKGLYGENRFKAAYRFYSKAFRLGRMDAKAAIMAMHNEGKLPDVDVSAFVSDGYT